MHRALVLLLLAVMVGVAEGNEPATEEIRTGPWRFSFYADTGNWHRLTWNGETVADNPGGAPATDVQLKGHKWLCRTDGVESKLVSHQWKRFSHRLTLTRRVGDWELAEDIVFGAKGNRNRIERTLRMTYLPPAGTTEPVTFHHAAFGTYLAKSGTSFFPAEAFSTTSRKNIADIPVGTPRHGGYSVWPLLIEQAPERTLLFVPDARRDRAHMFMRPGEDVLEVSHYFQAQGWAYPGVTQTVGPAYLDVAESGLDDAFRTAVWRWYDDVDLRVPRDRPDWVKDVVLYSFHPGGTIGSGFTDLGGFDAAKETLLPVLERLGIGALWILPVHDRGAYWPRDYYKLQKGIGTKDDYRGFVAAAHALGMKVLQDNVPHGGSPSFGRLRGNKPWWLVFDEKGDAMDYWCFDFRAPAWQAYMGQVAEDHTRTYGLDGFRIDAVGGSHGMNWRRRGFPTRGRTPANVPEDWWQQSLDEIGGEVPALPYERGSLTLREGGMQMIRSIRDGARRAHPRDSAILAEVQFAPYMQEADILYDFVLPHNILPRIHKYPPAEFVAGLQRWLEEQRLAEPRDTLRMRYVESHDTVRARGWYGVGAMKAATALTMWIHGVPMIYHDSELWQCPFLERIIAIRKALPELRRGEARYQAVDSSCPAVFTCLRKAKQDASIALVNFSADAVETTIPLPHELLDWKKNRRYAAWDTMSGSRLSEGNRGEMTSVDVSLPAWGATVVCLRPVGQACPVSVQGNVVHKATGAVAGARPACSVTDAAVSVKAPDYELVLDRRTGLLTGFADTTGRILFEQSELVMSAGAWQSGSVLDVTSFDVSEGPADVAVRFALSMAGGGEAELTYVCASDSVRLKAGIPDAAGRSLCGLLFRAPETKRYQISTAEGLIDDWFIVRHVPRAEGSHSIYYRPQGSDVIWQAGTGPLAPGNAALRALQEGGSGGELKLLNPLTPGLRNALVLDKFDEQPGWNAVFLFDPEHQDTLEIALRPVFTGESSSMASVPSGEGVPAPGVRCRSTSIGWEVENAHYRAEFRRVGGSIRSLAAKQPEPRTVLSDCDLYTDKGFRAPRVSRASSNADTETGVRCWRDGNDVHLLFNGMLRGEYRFGQLRPPIWFNVEYVFNNSPTFGMRWSVLCEGNVRDDEAFLAWVGHMPIDGTVTFSRGGAEIARGCLNQKKREGETANSSGGAMPDHTVFRDASGSAVLTFTDLEANAPAPLHNAFVHGRQAFLAWLDPPDKAIVPDAWYEARMGITAGAATPSSAPKPAWHSGKAAQAVNAPRNPSFELLGDTEVLLASAARTAAFPRFAPRRQDWAVPSGGSITTEIAHSGRRCAKVVNDTGQYRLFTQTLKTEAFPPGSTIRLSAWVKGESIVAGKEHWKTGIVGMTFRDANGKSQHPSFEPLLGTFDWRKVEGTLTVPEGIRGLMVRIGINGGTGTMWIDDVSVERVE